MPTFCRHNRLIQNCSICSREQNVAMRPVVTSSAPKTTQPRERSESGGSSPRPAHSAGHGTKRAPSPRGSSGVKVRRMARGAEDGYSSGLVPGLKSSEDAARLAEELVFAADRLGAMALVAEGVDVEGVDPIWSEIAGAAAVSAATAPGAPAPAGASPAAGGDLETRTSLAFQTVITGERGVDPERVEALRTGYEAWAARAGSQQQAFTGESSWTPERRFERIFERLSTLPAMGRDTRYELLTLLGGLGLYPLAAGKLFPAGENEATWAAKRVFGIGDPLLLERRAADMMAACELPLGALDLALNNWGPGLRIGAGLATDVALDEDTLDRVRNTLGL